MKQKRKVKSLIPQNKDWRGSFLTTLLLVLSVILCIGSASLMTMSIGEAAWNTDDGFVYTGIYEKSEVLYNMRFVDFNNLRNRVADTYISGKSLYITPSPVIVNPLVCAGDELCNISRSANQVGEDVYGHVLGGKDNKVYSNNITIIAGESNIVSGNDNASVLGGNGNSFGSMSDGGTPMVVVGGSGNKVGDNHNGVGLIGGKKNVIGDNVSNSFILGGETNVIGSGVNNAIVGGKNVNVVSGTSNVFVFSVSDSLFTPESSKAFYLNLGSGVGIGVGAPGKNGGLAVKGAISLGNIDIVHLRCNDENLGVKGSYKGCVVGCTIAGKNDDGKWEVLDRGEKCMKICRDQSNERCIYEDDEEDNLETVPDYTGYCTDLPNDYKTGIEPCFDVTVYKNVVFESSLVDNGKCPEGQENRCVFSCKDGYHLTGDNTNPTLGNNSLVKCYRDCKLPWTDANGKDIFIKQNETRIGYKKQNVRCAYPDPAFPASVFTCSGQKMNLVCYDGKLYEIKNGKRTTADVSEYKYETCELGDYSCDPHKYNLSSSDVINGKDNNYGNKKEVISNWNVQDRKTNPGIIGKRGQYSRCIDYTAGTPNNVMTGNETCFTGTNHYHLLSCNTHYTTGETHQYECLQQCSLMGKYGVEWYNHGRKVLGYKTLSPKCPDECESVELTCNDGVWEGGNASDYGFSACTTTPEPCDGYNISVEIYNKYNDVSGTESRNSIYEACQKYSVPSQGDCTADDVVYKLVDCKPGYHAEGDHCVINMRIDSCSFYSSYAKPYGSHYTRNAGYVNYNGGSQWVEKGDFLEEWTCGWTGSASCWNSPVPPDACAWECDETYHQDGRACVRDGKCSKTEPFGCEESGETIYVDMDDPGSDEDVYGYYWKCIGDGGSTDSCHICKDGNSWDEDLGTCVKNEDGRCLNENGLMDSNPRGKCAPLDLMPNGNYRWRNGKPDNFSSVGPIMFTWDCKGSGTGDTDYGCHQCFPNYTRSNQNQVCEPDEIEVDCGSKPRYTNWTDDGKIIQVWEGKGKAGEGEWVPKVSDVPVTHDPSGSVDCAFACYYEYGVVDNNYAHFKWNENTYQCDPMTRNSYCNYSDLPSNAEWTYPYQNGSQFTQTWSEENQQWLPSWHTTHYDPYGSDPCAFDCEDDFHYDSDSNTCVPNTNSESCGNLEEDYGILNATRVNNMFEQIWNGRWEPENAPTPVCVDGYSSTEECAFTCNNEYECNDDRTGCVWIDNRGCRNYEEYLMCDDGTYGTPTEVQDPADNHLYWKCGDSTCETCDSSKGYNYKNGSCTKCNSCMKNGFPYCFPIVVGESCEEWDYKKVN